jgi:hypothetical protein
MLRASKRSLTTLSPGVRRYGSWAASGAVIAGRRPSIRVDLLLIFVSWGVGVLTAVAIFLLAALLAI